MEDYPLPLFFNSLIAIILLMGGFAPSLVHYIPAETLASDLILSSIVVSVGLGFWWFYSFCKISTATRQSKDPHDVIDEFLYSSWILLSRARPRTVNFLWPKDREKSLMRVLADRFMLAPWFWMNLAAIYVGSRILTDADGSLRVFARLLGRDQAKSASLMLCLYMIISLTSIYSLGCFAKLRAKLHSQDLSAVESGK